MRVQIERWDKLTGIFVRDRYFYVRFLFVFERHEIEALRKSGTDAYTISPDEDEYPTTIRDLLIGIDITRIFDAHVTFTMRDTDSARIRRKEEDVRGKVERLKSFIDGVYTHTGTEEYEL